MKRLIIYRNQEDNLVYKVGIVPDKITEEEALEKVTDYNKGNDFLSASIHVVPEDLCDAILFLVNDRRLDVKSHIEELRDLEKSIDDIRYDISGAIERLEDRVDKQINNKK